MNDDFLYLHPSALSEPAFLSVSIGMGWTMQQTVANMLYLALMCKAHGNNSNGIPQMPIMYLDSLFVNGDGLIVQLCRSGLLDTEYDVIDLSGLMDVLGGSNAGASK